MGILDKAKTAISNAKTAIDTGNKETEGLGNELRAKSDMIRAARGESNTSATPAPKSEPASWEHIKRAVPPGEKPMYQKATEWAKPLGSFKQGTSHVPKTGVYKLHEGEAVIPKEKNTMNASDAMAGITGKAKPPKEIKAMTHTKTHNGKHIVTHHHHHPEHHPDETHAFDNMADVHSHMEDHAGVPNEGEEAPSGASAPAPLTAAPSPMPAPAAPGM